MGTKERFIIQKSEKIENGWVCTDQVNLISCSFENNKFSETQKFTYLGNLENPDVKIITKVCGEIGDWLKEFHDDKI